MKLKNLSSVILAAMMAATSVPAASLSAPYNRLSAYAVETAEPEEEAPIAYGLCGENLTWEVFAEEDSLVIDGTGAMTEWENAEDAPWAEYGDRISLIVIRENVESISENAFGATGGRTFYFHGYNCVIPDSETFLPENASIYGYDGSTAQAYAEKYGREFTSEGEYEAPSDENISTDENVPSDEEDSTVIEENRIVAEGMCGENLKWEIDSLEDILIISGYGEMTDWEKPEDAPWFEYSDEFDIVIIRPGVCELSENSLGSNAKIIYLESYNCVIPDSETVIPADAKILGYTGSTAQAYAEKYGREFDTLSGENEEYPLMEGVCTENLKWILWDNGSLAFYGYGDIVAENGVYPWDTVADSIKEVIISTAVKSIDENAFTNCTNLESVLMYTPDCQIADSADVFPSNVLLQVGDGSTAEEYAVKYNLTHVVYNFFTASGEIGDNLTWVLFSGGSLRIYGEGDMIDLGGVNPWAEYEDEITRVQIDEEVTSIDKSAFEGCDNIAEMIVLNPECKFAESEDAIPEDTVIYAAEGSGALMYAQLFGRSFKTLSSEITAPEEEESPIVAEGELGDNLKWNLNKNGDLSIEGTGEMPDCGKGGYPWSEYADQIKGVYFEKEVTSIGSYAFYNCTNLETMYLAPVIGEHAYDGCINVNGYSTYGDLTVNVIGDYAFNNCGYDVYEIDNPDCVIADSEFVFPVNATIWGYAGSTAQAHAEKYGLEFVEIKDNESYEGKCGETLEWNILSDNRLVINGDGIMDSYMGYSNWEEYTELFDTVEYSGELYNYGEYAFYNCKNLKSIELAPVIGAHAFEGCSNITSTITSGEFVLKEIGDYAFYGCDNLGGLIIENPECVIADSPYVFPEDMTIFGVAGSTAQAHAEKYGLEFVEIEYEEVYEGTCGEAINWSFDENTGYLWLRGEGVMNNWASADIVPWAEIADKITNISIDGNIESIGDYAFSGLTNLRSVQTEGTANQIARIGEHAFDGCTSLESTIFYNVEEIQDYAFYGCDSLEHLYLSSENCTVADSPNVFPEGILISGISDDLKAYAEKYNFKYDDCSVLAEGKLDDNYTWTLLNNGSLSIDGTGDMPVLDGESPWSEYADKVKFVFFDIESGSIGDYAFYNFKNLGGVGYAFVDDDFMSIGSHAFENCEKLAYFTAFENITEIGDYAFNGCDSLEVVYIRNPECVIADSEFVFPANTVIHGYAGSTAQAYAEKYGLDFVEIESVEQGFIAYGELGENLTWSLYNDGMLYIDGEGEMLECGEGGYPWSEFSDKITAVNFGKGVTSVGAYAFYNCKNITTIDTTKVIGEHAFDGCINVESVGSYMENAMTVVGDYAFNNCGFSLYTFDDPNCVIADSEFVFPDGATIWGHVGSTAQAHAEKYGLDFAIIEEESVTTTAPDFDSETTTTTTTTTTPNDSESELPQTGFAKAYDYLAFSAGVMALCGIYAMKKSKKKEDEE